MCLCVCVCIQFVCVCMAHLCVCISLKCLWPLPDYCVDHNFHTIACQPVSLWITLTVFALFVPFCDEIIFYCNPNVSTSKMADKETLIVWRRVIRISIHCNPKSHLPGTLPACIFFPSFSFSYTSHSVQECQRTPVKILVGLGMLVPRSSEANRGEYIVSFSYGDLVKTALV